MFANTTVMALDGTFTDSTSLNVLEKFNTAFTFIFIIEMSFKLIAFGVFGKESSKLLTLGYIRDKMNIFDACIVILSIVEMTMMSGGNKAFSAFRAIRIFRTFRVLRVTRLLRGLAFMQVIIGVVSRTLSSFIYIALLLFLFIIIYTLLGLVFGLWGEGRKEFIERAERGRERERVGVNSRERVREVGGKEW